MLQLYIANKNYSSWSLRPWVLLRELKIEFNEILIPFTGLGEFRDHQKILPSKKVPALHDSDIIVWDSLAIVEYLNDIGHKVWPSDLKKRAMARSICAEMHSGFSSLRSVCTMNCGVRIELHEISSGLKKDVERLNELLGSCLEENRGKFLFGDQFTAADAFFAPVAFRMQTYQLKFNPIVQNYFQHLLALPGMMEWYKAGINEKFRDKEHDDDLVKVGKIVQDLRS